MDLLHQRGSGTVPLPARRAAVVGKPIPQDCRLGLAGDGDDEATRFRGMHVHAHIRARAMEWSWSGEVANFVSKPLGCFGVLVLYVSA